jgi:hypothetical protein
MAYEILKGVPKPPSPVNQYNFDKMEVNDMLAVPIEDGEDHQKKQNKISSAASSYGKRNGLKFTTQVVKHNGKLIVGVWRIA